MRIKLLHKQCSKKNLKRKPTLSWHLVIIVEREMAFVFSVPKEVTNNCTSWCETCSCWIRVINLDGTFCCLDVTFGKMCSDDCCEMPFCGVFFVD